MSKRLVSQDDLWPVLLRRNRKEIARIYGDVMTALSHGLRGAITASPGKQLYVADYTSIEARVVLWLAGDDKHLEVFRTGQDIYLVMASKIYDRVCSKADTKERALGKIAVLGLGYQMGASKFTATCEKAGIIITEEFGQEVVTAYRSEFVRVKESWGAQEAAAIRAVLSREEITCGRVAWAYDASRRFLTCELPSGRLLYYPFPEIHKRMTPWGDKKPSLTYMGVDAHTRQWKRQVVYGGLLVENLTQAVARDIMAEALYRCEVGGVYEPVLSVHDELITEAPLGVGSVHAFETLVSQPPVWAKGCPIAAEGWAGVRYRKG